MFFIYISLQHKNRANRRQKIQKNKPTMKYLLIATFLLFALPFLHAQQFPEMGSRNYTSDSTRTVPRHLWRATAEVFGTNLFVWGVNRYIVNEDFARIDGQTIKNNFKTGQCGIPTNFPLIYLPTPTTVPFISTPPAATAITSGNLFRLRQEEV